MRHESFELADQGPAVQAHAPGFYQDLELVAGREFVLGGGIETLAPAALTDHAAVTEEITFYVFFAVLRDTCLLYTSDAVDE